MGRQSDDTAIREAAYLAVVERRIKWSDRAMNTRSFGQVFAWTVALLAGAGVAVAEVLASQWRWAPAVLGFVVVVAQGADRLFARTAGGAIAMESMRRMLTKEKRLYLSRAGPYAGAETAFDTFVERVERVLDQYDDASVELTAPRDV